MSTILWVNWLRLKRDRVALGLTFVLPIVFFSIFAMIFGGMGRGGSSGPGPAERIRVAVVDEDRTELSRRMIAAIAAQDSLEIREHDNEIEGQPPAEPYTREIARRKVRSESRYPVAVVIPEGFGDAFGNFAVEARPITLLYDTANPIAYQMVAGLLQAAAMQAAPDILLERGMETLAMFGGGLTDGQHAAVAQLKRMLTADEPDAGTGGEEATDDSIFGGLGGLVTVETIDVRAAEAEQAGEDVSPSRSLVAYYAAGIGVMFLLFSMTGAGGSLLDEEERGTLDRVLSSDVSMTTLLLGNWLFFALVGMLQIAVMFTWGALIFDLNLWAAKPLIGTIVLTTVTALAASAFGIVLATVCTSRAQLGGMSTIIILVMSALGGSMVPRFVMPPFMETTAKFTFNGWALDGYLKVFWYDAPDATLLESLWNLRLELAVLTGMTIAFLLAARVFARRWEAG